MLSIKTFFFVFFVFCFIFFNSQISCDELSKKTGFYITVGSDQKLYKTDFLFGNAEDITPSGYRVFNYLGLNVHKSKIFFSGQDSRSLVSVVRCDLDGSSAKVIWRGNFGSGAIQGIGVAEEKNYVFTAFLRTDVNGQQGSIIRTDLDGEHVQTIFSSTESSIDCIPGNIVVDNANSRIFIDCVQKSTGKHDIVAMDFEGRNFFLLENIPCSRIDVSSALSIFKDTIACVDNRAIYIKNLNENALLKNWREVAYFDSSDAGFDPQAIYIDPYSTAVSILSADSQNKKSKSVILNFNQFTAYVRHIGQRVIPTNEYLALQMYPAQDCIKNNCNLEGNCNKNKECVCDYRTFYGESCDSPCYCSNHGTCDKNTGACTCDSGWKGSYCSSQTPVVPATPPSYPRAFTSNSSTYDEINHQWIPYYEIDYYDADVKRISASFNAYSTHKTILTMVFYFDTHNLWIYNATDCRTHNFRNPWTDFLIPNGAKADHTSRTCHSQNGATMWVSPSKLRNDTVFTRSSTDTSNGYPCTITVEHSLQKKTTIHYYSEDWFNTKPPSYAWSVPLRCSSNWQQGRTTTKSIHEILENSEFQTMPHWNNFVDSIKTKFGF